MNIVRLETFEIRSKVLKVYHYKTTDTVVLIFANKEEAKEYASYFNDIRYIGAVCDNDSVLVYSKAVDRVIISTCFINKKENITILKTKRY